MLDENQMVHPGRSGDDGDAALDAALAAADQDMLSAISNGLDLDIGLARILGDLGGSPAAHPGIQAPAYPGEDRRRPDAAISRDRSSRIHTQGADAASPARVAVLIRDVNASDKAAEDQCLRARQAAGIAARNKHAAEQAAAEAERTEIAHRVIQAGHPRRHAPLPRQLTFALGTVVLDGLACYLAALALGGSLDDTLAWTGLFLGVLAGGEAALGFYGDRGGRAWRVLAVLIGFFVLLLGTLRLWFLATTGTGGLVPAIAGACLLTAVTAGFLTAGYRALRVAETPAAWRARRQAGTAHHAARLARAAADRAEAERDHLIGAYLGHVRQLALKTCPAGRLLAVESAVRQNLLEEPPSGEKDEPAAAADPDAPASSRAGLAVPGGQAAAIIAMRAGARALACALAQAHARACALRFAVRGPGRPVPVLGCANAIGRAFDRGLDRALLQARDVTRDLMHARDLARDLTRASAGDRALEAGHAIDLDRTVGLAGDLARDLALARGLGRTRDLADAQDLARGRARDRATDLARSLQEAVGRAEELAGRSHEGEVDASGADLSALDLTDISVLVGVVWTAETAWPPGIADQVRARSREIRPGVYRVCGGSERDPSELVRP
jgi:hypothetical protein